MNTLAANFLASFASAFSQSNRLLKLRFSPNAGIAEDTLLPWQLTGSEAINDSFRFELTCLSADAFLPLKQFTKMLEIGITIQSGLFEGNNLAHQRFCQSVTWFPVSIFVDEGCRALLLDFFLQSKHLTLADPEGGCCFLQTEISFNHLMDYRMPIQLRLAHEILHLVLHGDIFSR